MHKNFPDWYRVAGLDPKDEVLTKRWAAIEIYGVDAEDIRSLTRLFYRIGKPHEDFLNDFQSAFQEADSAFSIRNNDQELCVLAGAKLVDVLERGSDEIKVLAAVSLVCAAVQNLRPSPCVPEIPEIGARSLRKQTVARAKSTQKDEMVDALTALGEPYAKLASEFRKVQTELPIVGEESNMLWWLFSAHSRDENQRWTEFSLPAVALLAGKELADLTRVLPGPAAASAFLDQIIRSTSSNVPEKVGIKEAINDTPLEWRQRHFSINFSGDSEALMPITFGIKSSVASPQKNAWLPAFLNGTGLSRDSKLSPQALSYQIFLESLLRRAFESAEA